MSAKIMTMRDRPRPRTFTTNEAVVEYLSELIMADKRGYMRIAESVGVGHGTIRRIAGGVTAWPRPNTLFSLMKEYGIGMTFTQL